VCADSGPRHRLDFASFLCCLRPPERVQRRDTQAKRNDTELDGTNIVIKFGMTAALLGAIAVPAQAATVEITIANVRNANGVVHVDLCPQKVFLTEKCPYSGEAPAHAGTVSVTIHDVAPGQYAAQANHDENRNHKVDKNFLGIPKEGIGFSRDAKIHMAPPKFGDAVFAVDATPVQKIAFAMRYLL
jgi:uncharacterized protein (DUF2141 family)